MNVADVWEKIATRLNEDIDQLTAWVEQAETRLAELREELAAKQAVLADLGPVAVEKITQVRGATVEAPAVDPA